MQFNQKAQSLAGQIFRVGSSWESGTEGAVGNFQTAPPDRCCEGRHVVGPSLFDVIARRIGIHPAVGSGHLSLPLSDYCSLVPSVFCQKTFIASHGRVFEAPSFDGSGFYPRASIAHRILKSTGTSPASK